MDFWAFWRDKVRHLRNQTREHEEDHFILQDKIREPSVTRRLALKVTLALSGVKNNFLSGSDRTKGGINSCTSAIDEVRCVTAHFHDNVIRKSMKSIFNSESRTSDPPVLGSGGLTRVPLKMMEASVNPPELRGLTWQRSEVLQHPSVFILQEQLRQSSLHIS